MIIKELMINSFGKFKNKSIEFVDGINIVYGNNESGKTTIHKFIEGILYGFFKEYTKRKMYTDDYDKYMPWYDTDYSGILKYQHQNNVYSIERNFIKGKDEVKVFDDKTGEEITHLFEYDKTVRLIKPTSLHLDLNSIVYNNTVSVKQLKNKTDDDLAKEVKDSLINLGKSLDEDISIKGAIEILNKKMDEIGTKSRVKTSPYGKIVNELESLKNELNQSLKVLEDIKNHQLELKNIDGRIKSMELERKDILNKISLINAYKSKKIYDQAIKIQEEINTLNRDIEELKGYENIDPTKYPEAIKLDNSLINLKEDLSFIEEKYLKLTDTLKNLKEDLKNLEQFKEIDSEEEIRSIEDITSTYAIMIEKKKELDELKIHKTKLETEIKNKEDNIDIFYINKDFYEYESLEGERNALLQAKDYSNKGYLKGRVEEKESTLKKHNLFKIISIVMLIIPLSLGYLADPLLYFTAIIPIAFSIYFHLSTKEHKSYIDGIRYQMKDIEETEMARIKQINDLNQKMNGILDKYNCRSKSELLILLNDYSTENALYKDKESNLISVKQKISTLEMEVENYSKSISYYLRLTNSEGDISEESVRKLKRDYNTYQVLQKDISKLKEEVIDIEKEKALMVNKYEEYKDSLDEILVKADVENLEELKVAINKKRKYEDLSIERDNKLAILKSVMGNKTIEELKIEALMHNKIDDDIIDLNEDELKSKSVELDEDIKIAKEKYARLEERIMSLTASSRSIVEINEEINRKMIQKEKYENKLRALELARNKIDSISKEIQRDFAPELNRRVGNIINTVTDGKYSEVKITEELGIKLVDPNSNKLVDISSLSGGTIDQLYFATRIGIISIIKENRKIPLILDDCFTQYDINRLEGILNYLAKEGAKRQIILFTCHKREAMILDKIGYKYNYIEI